MRNQIRTVIERTLRRVPVLRAVYAELAALRMQLLEAHNTMRATQQSPAIQWLGGLDAHRLESLVPAMGTTEERTLMALRCRDADSLPKVAGAGDIVEEPDGTRVQIMHNGIKVLAGGYYGDWMQDLISRCRGHHEPQEERVFAEVVRHLPTDGVMFELGPVFS
jgi:hypothetical protein